MIVNPRPGVAFIPKEPAGKFAASYPPRLLTDEFPSQLPAVAFPQLRQFPGFYRLLIRPAQKNGQDILPGHCRQLELRKLFFRRHGHVHIGNVDLNFF